MFIVLCRSNGLATARLGLAIGKKHCKLATGRNRQKRIVRESFRQHKSLLTGLDVVVINQPGASRAGNRALLSSLEQHWRRCSTAASRKAK